MDISPPLGQIEALSGIRVPPSANHVRAQVHQVLNKRMLHLRFDAEPAELERMLASSPFSSRPSLSVVPELLVASPRPSWFSPESAKRFFASETRGKAILIDTGQSSFVIYVAARG